MFISVFNGQKYSYSYETNTGHYLLYSNDYKIHNYLQGDDAKIFKEEIDKIDNLPPPQCNDGRITENIISIYL